MEKEMVKTSDSYATELAGMSLAKTHRARYRGQTAQRLAAPVAHLWGVGEAELGKQQGQRWLHHSTCNSLKIHQGFHGAEMSFLRLHGCTNWIIPEGGTPLYLAHMYPFGGFNVTSGLVKKSIMN